MRKILVTSWIAVLFILLLADDSFSRKPGFSSRSTSGRSSSFSNTMLSFSKPSSSSWKPGRSNSGSSRINPGSSRINPGSSRINPGFNKPRSSFRKPDFPDMDDISTIYDIFSRQHESTPDESSSSSVRPGFPMESHPSRPIYPLHKSTSLKGFFASMPNISQLVMFHSDRMQKLLQKTRESSRNKSRSSADKSSSSTAKPPQHPAFLQDPDFLLKPNATQIMLDYAFKCSEFIQRHHESPPDKSGSSSGFPIKSYPSSPIYPLHNLTSLYNSDFDTNMRNISQRISRSSSVKDLLQILREFSSNKSS